MAISVQVRFNANSFIEYVHHNDNKDERSKAMWDLFISHASEDKAKIVRPLADMLKTIGLNVWYDEFELKPGSRLIETIEKGLQGSKYGLVIISRAFLEKEWPKRELNSLFTKELAFGESERIIPVWVDVDYEYIAKYSLSLANRFAIKYCAEEMELGDLACRIAVSVNSEIANSYARIGSFRELRRNHNDALSQEVIKLDEIAPSSPRHKTLPKNIILVSQLLCDVFGDISSTSLDQTILNFARDLDYEMEAVAWTAIASTYLDFFKSHPELFADKDFKTRVYSFLLHFSMGMDDKLEGTIEEDYREDLKKRFSIVYATLLVKCGLEDQVSNFEPTGKD